MWKPASTWTTSPVVERPRSESSHRAQPATPSIEVSSFIADMLALLACSPVADPPGPSVENAPETQSLEAPPEPAGSAETKRDLEPGHGAKIASIAMRTWVYFQPDGHSTKLGYLRAGAVVERAEQSAGKNGCDGGWYRIAPRGYVCVG